MEYRLTLGAHLLLWVFPLVLSVAAIAAHVLEGRRRAER